MKNNQPGFDPISFQEQIDKLPISQLLHQADMLKRQLKTMPRNFELHYALGCILERLEEYNPAADSFKKAHKLNKKSEIILKKLCELLLYETKNYSEALKFLRRWTPLRAGDPMLWAYVADCQVNLDKPEVALKTLEKAEALGPGVPLVHVTKAEAYSKLGQTENSKASLVRAKDLGAGRNMAVRLANLPNHDADDEQVELLESAIEQTLKGNPDNVVATSGFHSALGTIYEKRKNYEKAFFHIAKSNEARIGELDRDKKLAPFANLREGFTPEFMKEKQGVGIDSEQPIFIVGMPRSGTTLTESILAGHPDIMDNGELSHFTSYLNSLGMEVKVDELAKSLLPTFAKSLHAQPNKYFEGIAEHYIKRFGYDKHPDKRQVDKLPHNFEAVGLITLCFPNAKIIHCRRHPLDGALSCFKTMLSDFHSYSADLSFLGLYYRQYWELMKYWRELLPGKMYEVFYEDTVANTEYVARELIDFLELEWDPACLDHTSSKKTVNTASIWQVRQPIYSSSVAKWKHYENQLQPMIKSMGSIIEDYEEELAGLHEKNKESA